MTHLDGVSELDGLRITPGSLTGIYGATAPLLDQAEETRLARLIEAGVIAQAVIDGHGPTVTATSTELEQIVAEGKRATEQFVLSNLRLAWSVAIPAARLSGLPADDLAQEAVLAMGKVLQRFRPEAGRFSTFAKPQIEGHIKQVVATRNGAAIVPAHEAREVRRAKAIAARIEAATGQPATVEAVAAELGRQPASTARLLAHQYPVLAGDSTTIDYRVDPGPDQDDDVSDQVREGLARLPVSTRQMLALRYGFSDGRPHTYEEIGAQLRMSTGTVRRACVAALATLRETPSESQTPPRPTSTRHGAALTRIDKLSAMGMSLVEVGIAMRTDPHVIVQVCQSGSRDDLLRRFTGAEERLSGPQPAGVDLLARAIKREAAYQAAKKVEADAPQWPERPVLSPRVEALVAKIDQYSALGLSLLEVALATGTDPATVYETCQTSQRGDLVARLTDLELRMTGPQPAGTDVLAATVRRDAEYRASRHGRPERPTSGRSGPTTPSGLTQGPLSQRPARPAYALAM